MSNTNDDLRSTEDAVRQDAREIERLEAEKQDMDAGDARVGSISSRVERVSRQLHEKASTEHAIADESEETDDPDR